MKIEDSGKLNSFETMPEEVSLFISVVRYSPTCWSVGPSDMNKNKLITSLQNWGGIDAARIYEVKVPATSLPAA